MSFSDIEEDQLILLVREYPALYDASHENFLNSVAKDQIWNIIGEELNKTSGDCKKQWKLIRDSYARFKKKNKLGTSTAAQKKSKQKRHAQLAFLDSCVSQYRAGGSTVVPLSPKHKTEDSSISPPPEEVNGVKGSKECGITNIQMIVVKHEVIDLTEQKLDETLVPTTSIQIKTDDKKIQKRTKRDILIKLRQQRDANRQNLINAVAKRKEDDIDLFSRHIAEVLRNLPPLDRTKAKKHLSGVLSEYEISAATRLSHSDNAHTPPDYNASNYCLCQLSPSPSLGTPSDPLLEASEDLE